MDHLRTIEITSDSLHFPSVDLYRGAYKKKLLFSVQ